MMNENENGQVKRKRLSDPQEILTAAIDATEQMIVRVASKVVGDLKAPYDTHIFADIMYYYLMEAISELQVKIRVDRNVIVPISAHGRTVGNLKVPFVFQTSSGKRNLLVMEIKTKRSALKDTDLDSLHCAVEQMCQQSERTRAIVLNFAGGEYSSIVMQEDGTITT